MVVCYCHGSERYSVELDLDGVQVERSDMRMTQTYSHISEDFEVPAFNLSGVCKMALEGRLKRVTAGSAVRVHV
jgi:hypothetical protein